MSVAIIFVHPCDPTVMNWYLIWLCDMDIHITHPVSHSSSLSCHTVNEGNLGWVHNKYKTTFGLVLPGHWSTGNTSLCTADYM